ncbi:MAG: hypothetical protein KBC34_01025 [Phenylobacterium sp.]|nr:hypothetical protein [Phenylobacterium sp.]
MEFHLAQPNQGMDWLQFWASIVGSVAWPIAAASIAWMFKRQISALLDKVRRLSWGDGAIDLSEKLTEVEAVALEIPAASDDDAGPQIPTPVPADPAPVGQSSPIVTPQPEGAPGINRGRRARWSQVNPSATLHIGRLDLPARARIDEDWQSVEAALRKIPGPFGKAWPDHVSVVTMAELLAAEGKIDPRLHALLLDMASIYRTAGAGDVSGSDAWRFQTLALEVIRALHAVEERFREPRLL